MKAKESAESRQRKIEIAAYHLAERRHFAPGHEVADWLAAEEMVAREDAVAPAPASVAPPKSPPKAKPAKVAKTSALKEPKPFDAAAPLPETKAKSKAKRPPAAP